MNVECTLEMLQPELWLVVSMRKRSESFKSFSADTRFDFCVSLSVHWFVCLFALSFSKPYSSSSAILTLEGVWKSVQGFQISHYWMFFCSRW